MSNGNLFLISIQRMNKVHPICVTSKIISSEKFIFVNNLNIFKETYHNSKQSWSWLNTLFLN